MVDWLKLPDDILSLIYKRFIIVDNYICFRNYFCFRLVCKSWRSVAMRDSNVRLPQPPWLMLGELEYFDDDEKEKENNPTPIARCCFIGLSEPNKIYEVQLPEVHQNKCVGSTGTWLITIDTRLRIQLLNPFSRIQIELPWQSTFKNRYLTIQLHDAADADKRDFHNCFSSKVILSSCPSQQSSGDCIVMAINGYNKKLEFARPGDTSWTTIHTACHSFDDVIFFKDRFYAINRLGILVDCNIDGPYCPRAKEVMHISDIFRDITKFYLVEWLGELLLVFRVLIYNAAYHDSKRPYKTRSFEVYKLDLATKTKNAVRDLGQHSLFLGYNTSVSLLASDSTGCRRNCIYFTDDSYFGTETKSKHDIGVFDLEDGSIQPFGTGLSAIFSRPLWVIPKCIIEN